MKITDIRIGKISVPLRVPFKTSLRTVNSVEDVVVEIHTDDGRVGYGEAPPTGAITGDTTGAIIGALRDHIIKTLVGHDVAEEFEDLMHALQGCVVKNTSAKAAADMALWDLYGQSWGVPVYKLLGGSRKKLTTDITISVNDPEEMVRDTENALARGYDCLKIKVGKDADLDFKRLSAVRRAAPDVTIRIDANQGWTPKEAVTLLNRMQENGLQIELVEQPVKAHDFAGLKYVTERSYVPVLADESVFSPEDAMTILQMGAADLLNIKLMKTGGLYNALKIAAAAEVYGVECMLGCMLEAKIAVNAAVHLACARQIITKIDLDGPVLCTEDPVLGGAVFREKEITVSDEPGLGVRGIEPGKLVYLD